MKIVRLILLALFLTATSSAAQDGAKTLHWRRIDVVAHLDQNGLLRVQETQHIVFNGDWNGGERTFNMRRGQHLDFHGIQRIDERGSVHPLRRGELESVDEFAWTSSSTVRWRSRLPGDPIFQRQEMAYRLDYTLSNILVVKGGNSYSLDHDFAFPDRAGVIESFTLDLTVDDVWKSTSPLPIHITRTNLQPGHSVVATLPLQYSAAGHPSGVLRGPPLLLRLFAAFLAGGTLIFLLRRFREREKTRGRFEPLIPVETIDAAWLRGNVLSMPPEVVGAAWDNATSTPEVAAMIARMVMEGKLTSRVESQKWKEVLHLELKAPRHELSGDERVLVDALFAGSETTTDTERIKKRYKSTGLDLPGLLRDGIKKQVSVLSPDRRTPGGRRVLFTIALVVMVLASGGAALAWSLDSPAILASILIFVLCMIALAHAVDYRGSVDNTVRKSRRMVLFLTLGATALAALALGVVERGAPFSFSPWIAPGEVSVRLMFALVVMFLTMVLLILNAARTREHQEQLELRRKLAAGRAFFVRELHREKPSLEDEWYPYLIAFGLGKHIDKWFRAFGADTHRSTTIASTAAMTGSGMSSGGWTGGGPQFGGGGGFGGGGAGRSWASAVGGIAGGVSAPSSSSGGGGGGGGGSSGGGGGGGW